jgi:hypothetical protein
MMLFLKVEVELDPKGTVETQEDDWEQYNDNCTF